MEIYTGISHIWYDPAEPYFKRGKYSRIMLVKIEQYITEYMLWLYNMLYTYLINYWNYLKYNDFITLIIEF